MFAILLFFPSHQTLVVGFNIASHTPTGVSLAADIKAIHDKMDKLLTSKENLEMSRCRLNHHSVVSHASRHGT